MDPSNGKSGEQANDSGSKEINISINGESNQVKSMSPDESSRAGLTKDELMKYANEPFWIRLRNTLFAAFWIVWVSILIAAVGYVVKSPGCQLVAAAGPGANATTSAPSSG